MHRRDCSRSDENDLWLAPVLTICFLMHRRDRSRGDGMDALIGERLEHGVYNLRLEFLQPFLRWSTLAFVLAFNFVI